MTAWLKVLCEQCGKEFRISPDFAGEEEICDNCLQGSNDIDNTTKQIDNDIGGDY